MRTLSVVTLVTLVIVILCGSGAALAQPAPRPDRAAKAKGPTAAELDARVAKVVAEVAELGKLAAELPALQQAVADLTTQVAALRQEVDALARVQKTEVDARDRADALDARLTELAQTVASLRSAVQAQGAPESAAAGGAATYQDGFVLATADGRFSLRAKGYAQLRWTGRANEDADDVLESGFLLRRARLAWDGNLHAQKLGYKIMVDAGQGQVQLLDYYVEGKVGKGVSVRGGQFKVPFDRDFVTGAEKLSFVERSVATEEFRYDRDLGLLATWTGLGGRLEVMAGVWNGAGKNVKGNDNIDPLLLLRVGGTAMGEPWRPEEGDFDGVAAPALYLAGTVTFENAPVPAAYGYTGGGPVAPVPIGNRDVNADGDVDNVRVVQAGLDVALRWRGLGVEAEGYWRREDWGVIGAAQAQPFAANGDFVGGFAQASYFVLPGRVQVGARAAYTGVSPLAIGGKKRAQTQCTDATGAAFDCALPVSDVRRELSLVVGYFRHRHGVELQGMYSLLDWGSEEGASPAGAGEHRLLVEAQVGF